MTAAPPEPPERIHCWQNTHMSVARYYGGLEYQGKIYFIARSEPGQPLVRVDVLDRETKAKKDAAKAKRLEKSNALHKRNGA